MAKRSNQEVERCYFEMFRRDNQLSEGIPVYGDKPDVILKGKKKIGVEIVRFFLEDGKLQVSEQAQREAREAVVSKAQQAYLNGGGKRIEISFSFDKASPIRDRRKLARQIAELAKKIDGLKTGSISKNVFKDIPELSIVYLNAKEYVNPKWRVFQCDSVPRMSMDTLRAIISAKEEQTRNYKSCDAYWLLVVIDFFDNAQDQEIQTDGSAKVTSTVFERVFVYKTCIGDVLEAK